jgi:hypothetical protein
LSVEKRIGPQLDTDSSTFLSFRGAF